MWVIIQSTLKCDKNQCAKDGCEISQCNVGYDKNIRVKSKKVIMLLLISNTTKTRRVTSQ